MGDGPVSRRETGEKARQKEVDTSRGRQYTRPAAPPPPHSLLRLAVPNQPQNRSRPPVRRGSVSPA